MRCAYFEQLVQKAGDVLAGGHTGYRAGEDVVEHQGGDADLGEGAAEGFLHDAIDAAAGEHGTALDVDGADGAGEEDDADDEPGGRLTYELFGDAACIEGGGAKVIEDNGGCPPEGDERQHDRGGNDESYASRGCCDSFFESHSILTSGMRSAWSATTCPAYSAECRADGWERQRRRSERLSWYGNSWERVDNLLSEPGRRSPVPLRTYACNGPVSAASSCWGRLFRSMNMLCPGDELSDVFPRGDDND